MLLRRTCSRLVFSWVRDRRSDVQDSRVQLQTETRVRVVIALDYWKMYQRKTLQISFIWTSMCQSSADKKPRLALVNMVIELERIAMIRNWRHQELMHWWSNETCPQYKWHWAAGAQQCSLSLSLSLSPYVYLGHWFVPLQGEGCDCPRSSSA